MFFNENTQKYGKSYFRNMNQPGNECKLLGVYTVKLKPLDKHGGRFLF